MSKNQNPTRFSRRAALSEQGKLVFSSQPAHRPQVSDAILFFGSVCQSELVRWMLCEFEPKELREFLERLDECLRHMDSTATSETERKMLNETHRGDKCP